MQRGPAVATALVFVSSLFGADVDNDKLSSMGRLARKRIKSLTSAGVGLQSNSPCFNVPDCESGDLPAGQGQAETSIAVDSTGQHVVIGFNDFRGFSDPTGAVSVSGFFYSDDGGVTLVDGGRLPTGPTTVLFGQRFPQIFGDPDVKYIGGCTFVYSSLILEAFGVGGLVQSLAVHRSTDCGHTWQGPFDVTAAINPNGKVDVNGDAVDGADKELADVDPDTGRYMLCWSNFTSTGVEISCTFSDNITAPVPTFSPRRLVASTDADGQGSAVRFAGNGSPNAYVAWARFPGTLSGYANNVGFARSTDNGVTWSAPINLTSDFVTMDQVLGNDRVNTFPSLAVDKSSGPFAGSVYVVYSNNNSRDGADVAFQRSTNGGVSFSAPVFLNSRPGNDRAQWFPYVTVDKDTGRVFVFYYDQGIDSSGDLTELTYLYSDNGGTTWSRPAPLSDTPFKAGWGNDTSQPNLGDYNQAVALFGSLYASYASTTPLGFADGQPSTSMTTPDVQFKKVTPALRAPLRTGDVTFADSGGNGNIDPGEQVNLAVSLVNYVTNTLAAVTLSGITATLSTTTPGVTVTQASVVYPTLPPGATALPLTTFTVQTSPAFVPGTTIQFNLTVQSAQGPASLAFTQVTGTPVYTTLLSQNFDGVAPGALPAGWTVAHGAGANTVPWTTNNTFCGSSNKAFHINAHDGATTTSDSRWERFLSPSFVVPGNAEYVTIEFDVCYDTEDDPNLRVQAYDGFFLRVADLTPGRTVRSVLVEAFETEFTTGGIKHYPRHFPRSDDPSYFADMSVWGGFSNGPQHVRMRLPGMAGSTAQLRFEFAQDQIATCADVRPGHACGVSVDNVVVRSALSVAPIPASVELRTTSIVRDLATGDILVTLGLTNPGSTPASSVTLSTVSLNGTAVSPLPAVGTIAAGGTASVQVRFPGSLFVQGTAAVLRVAGSFSGGSFTSSLRVTIP